MSSPPEDLVVVITGTRTGLGRQLSECFLARGARVVGCSRGASDLAHPAYAHFQADVGSESDVKTMFLAVRRQFGRLDVLINNAGLFALAPVLLTSGGVVEQLFRTNLLGTVLCCREAAVLMKKADFGRIVNFTTIAVPKAFAGNAVYSASKAAIEQFTRVLAKEVLPFGITVNSLGFPLVEGTGMAEALPAKAADEALRATALGRMVTSAEVMHAVEFFLAADSRAVSGQVLYLGGP